MEAKNERERYIANPMRLLRTLAEVALMKVQVIDDAQDVWPDDYPPLPEAEAPVATEWELIDPDQLRLF